MSSSGRDGSGVQAYREAGSLPTRVQELERALARAQADRAAQATAVEDELVRLRDIYRRMQTDLRSLRVSRDRARTDAREQRVLRARETLELAQRLEVAEEVGGAVRPVPTAYVSTRIPGSPTQYRELGESELPEIPGYKVIDRLGRGGMARVFRALTLSDGHDVAIKLLVGDTGHSAARTELFLREAAATLQLDHPGLVRAFDVGECANGPYLVMQLVHGESLASRVRRDGPLGEGDAVEVGLQVAEALIYCAKLGLTHRDVKPSNVLMSADSRVKLCDFGLTALHQDDGGQAYGSPGYAAPEQLLTPRRVDERADIYGLGCTLWHIVVGHRPFGGGAKDTFGLQRTTDLPDPRFEGADVSARLAEIIRKMGRADRDQRYGRWHECVLDLMLAQRGSPPFAAQLSEALAPHRAPRDAGDSAPADDNDTGSTLTSAPRVSSASQPSTRTEPRSRRRNRSWWMLAALVAAGLLGAAIGASTRPTAADVLEQRARELADEGKVDEAVYRLRQAALLLPANGAAQLRAAAEELDPR